MSKVLRRGIIVFLLTSLAVFFAEALPAGAEEQSVTVKGVGFIKQGDLAGARDRAIRDAQVRALEQALGVRVEARTALHKSLLIDDTLVTRTRGMVQAYHVLEEGREQSGLYWVRLRAVVDTGTVKAILRQQAGNKKVLILGPAEAVKGETLLGRAMAERFAAAGFQVSSGHLAEADRLRLDANGVQRLAETRDQDLILSLSLQCAEPSCPVENLCAAVARGDIILYAGRSGRAMVRIEENGMRGFGNTQAMARQEAWRTGVRTLMQSFEARLFAPPTRQMRVEIRDIPDYAAYSRLKTALSMLRWVQNVKEDSVGFHPAKSVFLVGFQQEPQLLAEMLDQLQGCRLLERRGRTVVLGSEQ